MNKNQKSVLAYMAGLHTLAQFALYYPGCDEEIVDPSNTDCPEKELGDIRGIALVKNTFAFTDISSTAEWTAGIEARSIYVFNQCRGGLTLTPQEQPGFGDQDTTQDGYAFEANVFEPNYKANWAFWNSIKGSKNWKLVYRTETQVHITDVVVDIIPMAPITEGEKKTAIIWNIIFKWAQESLPQPVDMPSGVFNRAIAVS